MSTQWLEFLHSEGLKPDSTDDSLEPMTAVETDRSQLIGLADLKIVEIVGNDAFSFLQGQLCNDLAQVSPTQAQITGYCNPKGRLLALPLITAQDNGYFLILPENVTASFCKRLTMFVLRADVSIRVRDDMACVGLVADVDGSFGSAEPLAGQKPSGLLSTSTDSTIQWINWHADFSGASRRERLLRIAPVTDQITFWQACGELCKSPAANWQLADITAGLPSITERIKESFVPQMVNLQLINALSFTKGCYPGQEIVARMQYLGKLKRHMRLFHFQSAVAPLPGDSLQTGDDEAAGTVVSAVSDSTGSGRLLAVVKVSVGQSTMVTGETTVTAAALPYELPSPDQRECPQSVGG
jgi:folate-binding protein YgfZ